MAFVYPPYLIVENEFNRLWSINDDSWGFYGYDISYTKRSDTNKKYENLHFYWNDENDLFKITYGNYEGIFNKKNYKNLSNACSISWEDTVVFSKVIKNIELKELTHKYVMFEYGEMQFKLYNVDFEYIKNINNDTIILNDAIKKIYEEGIKWRTEILNKCVCDY
jgi:hypothetical protein